MKPLRRGSKKSIINSTTYKWTPQKKKCKAHLQLNMLGTKDECKFFSIKKAVLQDCLFNHAVLGGEEIKKNKNEGRSNKRALRESSSHKLTLTNEHYKGAFELKFLKEYQSCQ